MTKNITIAPIELYDFSTACLEYDGAKVEESRNLKDGTKIDIITTKKGERLLILHICTGAVLYAKIIG